MPRRRSQAAKAAEVPEKAAEVPEKAAEVPEKAAKVLEQAAEVPEQAAEPVEPMNVSAYPDTVDGIEEEALDDDDIFPVVPAKKPALSVEPIKVSEATEEAKGPAASPRKVIDVLDDDSDPDATGNPPIPGLHTDEPEEELVEYWVPTRYEVEDAVGPDYIPYVFNLPRVEPPQFIFSVGEIAQRLLPELKAKHSLSKRKHREEFCISCLDFKLKNGECSTKHDEHNDDRFQEFWLKEYPHTDVLTKQSVIADLEDIAVVWA